MAVPMTAVLRIFLKNVEHPLPRWVAEVMGGPMRRGRRSPKPRGPFMVKSPGHML